MGSGVPLPLSHSLAELYAEVVFLQGFLDGRKLRLVGGGCSVRFPAT